MRDRQTIVASFHQSYRRSTSFAKCFCHDCTNHGSVVTCRAHNLDRFARFAINHLAALLLLKVCFRQFESLTSHTSAQDDSNKQSANQAALHSTDFVMLRVCGHSSQDWNQYRSNSNAPAENGEPPLRRDKKWTAKEKKNPSDKCQDTNHDKRSRLLPCVTASKLHRDQITAEQQL
ncbi:MAG: hypothetical protein HY298_24730 [Verrucomicrobia bacterium]|nr:hypothetical protein [Verrucomicrobiota bacterium]